MSAKPQHVERLSVLLERRLEATRSLCEALEEYLPALAELDLDAMEHCISRQSELCDAIASVDSRLQRIAKRRESHAFIFELLDPEVDSESLVYLRSLVEELRTTQKRAKRLNETVSELVRRSRISNTALLNAISQQTSLTYSNPLERFSHAERG